MHAFEHISIDQKGQKQKGIVEADSDRQARQILRGRLLTPLTLYKVQGIKRSRQGKSIHPKEKIHLRELSILTRQLATLIKSGLPLEQAIQALVRQGSSSRVQSVLSHLRTQILEGKSFSGALEEFPSSFSEMYRTSVRAGERTGHLDRVLEYLANFTDEALQARQKILLALLYPAILTIVSLLIIFFMMTYIVPGMIKVFSSAGHDLPLLTKTVIALSNTMQEYGWIVSLVFLGCVMGTLRLLKQSNVRQKIDKLLLRLPLIGPLVFEYGISRFASTLGMLQESSVPLIQGLEIAGAVIHNIYLRNIVTEITRKVSEGKSLSSSMEVSGVFPPVLITMTASGEASGRLGSMLLYAGAMLQRDAENRTAVLLKVFEPLVLLVMGGVVLLLVLSIILPILNLNQLVQ